MANQHTAYTPAENEWLRAHYATASREAILAAAPGHNWQAIQNQASKLGASGRPKHQPACVTTWTPERVALLRAHYPTGGSAAVAALTGLSCNAIREHASRLRLSYVAGQARAEARQQAHNAAKAARITRAARPAKVRQRAAPKPAPTPKPKAPAAPVLAVKRSAGTPNLNVQKEARKQKELAPQKAAAVTAEQIRKLPANHPGRHAYSMGGVSGWQQWRQQQPAA